MHKVKIYKAQGIDEEEVESLLIEFSEEIPRPSDLKEGDDVFEQDGIALEHSLYHVLPGGTYGGLLREMLKRRASQLVVSWGGLQDAS